MTKLIVKEEERQEFERYCVENFQLWSNESIAFQKNGGYDIKYQYPPSQVQQLEQEGTRHLQESIDTNLNSEDIIPIEFENGIPNKIWSTALDGTMYVMPESTGPYLPLWQHAPYIDVDAELGQMGGPEWYKVELVDKMASMVCLIDAGKTCFVPLFNFFRYFLHLFTGNDHQYGRSWQ